MKRGVMMKYRAALFYFVCFIVTLVIQICMSITPTITFRVYQKIGMFGIELLFLLLTLFFLLYKQSDRLKRRRAVYIILWIFTLLYIGNLLFILYLDKDFGRNILVGKENIYNPSIEKINLVPFRVIQDYIKAYRHGNLLLVHLISNILGNIILFSPLGFLLPTYFKAMNKISMFCIFIILFIAGLEFMQLYLDVGVCDIDDFLLNTIGAILANVVYHIPIVNKIWYQFLNQEK